MRIELLGPVVAFGDDGTQIDLGGQRVRALFARLALAGGDAVSVDTLFGALWGDQPGTDPIGALHALVHRLRRALPASGLLASVARGYQLDVRPDQVDALRFEELAAAGARELAAGDPARAAAQLREGLALWRGEALSDMRSTPFAAAAGARLDELRLSAQEDHFDALLRLGRHGETLVDLETTASAHPLRERLTALRMRALHAAGRPAEALAAYEDVRAMMADELGIGPSETLREAHLSVLRDEPAPVATTLSAAASNRLPAPLTSFIGREDESRMLSQALVSSRLVTLVGPGGVGKTRLAVQTAGVHPAGEVGRVWFVPLAAAESAESVIDAVLGTLSPTDAPPTGSSIDRAVALLDGDGGLLILDNCEQVSAAAAEVAAELLERLPRLRILATSREPLGILGETLCRLRPLDVPEATAGIDAMSSSAAVQLFVDRAAAVHPGFAVDAVTAAPLLDVVRRLDGLPLALELAAARLRSMGIDQVAHRLDDRFRLLRSGNRAAQPRQQTLRAVIEWSWELLTPTERALAARLSVFSAQTGPATIEAVCADEELGADDVIDALDSLVDKSIVERTKDGYRMLESIRAHAGEKLRETGEAETVLDRAIRHFAALAAEQEPLLRSVRQESALRLFQTEHENLVHALQSAIESGDAASAARLLAPLYWYWVVQRYDPRADGLVARVADLGAALSDADRTAFTALRRIAIEGAALADPQELRTLIEDCVRADALRRHPMLLTTVLVLAPFFGMDALADEEIARVRGGADRWAVACTHMIDAMRWRERGDLESCAASMTTALQLFEQVGDRWWEGKARYGLAQLHTLSGAHAQAIADFERSLAIAVALGSQDEISTRLGLAGARMRAADFAGAQREIEAAEAASARRGQPVFRIDVFAAQAELRRRAGSPEDSDEVIAHVEQLLASMTVPTTIPSRMLLLRTANRLALEDRPAARALLRGVVRAAQETREAPVAGHLVSRMCGLDGDLTAAVVALGLSHALRGGPDNGDLELRAWTESLAARLGRDAFEAAYRQAAAVPADDALARLDAMAKTLALRS